jgi:hypothetical protein
MKLRREPGAGHAGVAIVSLCLASLLALAGCIAAGPPAPIPTPLAEAVPKPPVSPVPLSWQPGHWDWTGTSYVWTPGQYVDAAGHGSNWMTGWWEKTDSGWVWRPAHWM